MDSKATRHFYNLERMSPFFIYKKLAEQIKKKYTQKTTALTARNMSSNKTPQEEYFDKEFLVQIKKILEEEQKKIQKELSSFTSPNPDDPNDFNANFPNYGDEEDDNVQEIEQFTVNKPLEIILEKKLRDVNSALDRLKKGTYGICKYTGNPIDKQRLLARPTSSSTIDAKKVLKQEP